MNLFHKLIFCQPQYSQTIYYPFPNGHFSQHQQSIFCDVFGIPVKNHIQTIIVINISPPEYAKYILVKSVY